LLHGIAFSAGAGAGAPRFELDRLYCWLKETTAGSRLFGKSVELFLRKTRI
jgi:hypothetical protein